MKSTYKSILLVVFSILSTFIINKDANATHVAGGYFQFECTGTPGEYIARLTLYRDCSGTTLSTTGVSVNFSNDCGGSGSSTNFSLVSMTEVSQLCAAELSNSTCNGGSQPGYEEYIYETTVNLSACDDWNVYYSLCCRNSSNNVSGQPDFYVESNFNTSINNCTTTPVVTAQPEPYVCINQPVSYNLGAYEPDGHTLQYALVNALEAPGSSVPYNGGFSGGVPIPGITIDPNTGTVNFTPTTTGAYIIVIQILEYDAGGNLISTTNYDYQTFVVNCTNQVPQPPAGGLSNVNGSIMQNGPSDVTFCQNNNGCFDVVFDDADPGDVLTVQSNIQTVMPGAVVNQSGTNPLTVSVCWTPTSTSGTSTINFLVEDDACPLIGQSNYTVTVNVQASMTVDLGPDVMVNCGATTNITSNVNGGSGNYSYVWNDNPAQNGTNINNVGSGTYWVEVTDNTGTGCNAFDTIVVSENTPHTADFTFNSACEGSPITFNDNTTPNGTTLNTFLWDFDGDGNTDASGTSVNHTFPSSGNYTVELLVEDLGGCTSIATHDITVNPLPNPTIDPVADICENAAAFALTGNPAGGTFSGTGVSGTNFDPNAAGIGTHTVTYDYTDGNGCSNSTTEDINVIALPSPTIDPVTDLCVASAPINLTGNPAGGTFSGNGVTGISFDPATAGIGTHTITYDYTDGNGCNNSTTTDITVIGPPTIDAGVDYSICDGDATTLTANNPDGANLSWDNSVTDGVAFNPAATNTYEVTADIGGCISTDQITVTVNPNPTFAVAGVDPAVCGGQGTITLSGLTPNTAYDVSYDDNSGTVGPNNMNSDANGDITINEPAGSYNNFVVTDPTTGCSTSDPTSINLTDPNAPPIDAGPDQTICVGENVTLIANNPNGAVINWSGGVTDGVAFSPATIGTNTYTVTADDNGCISSDQVNVIVLALPTVVANASSLAICENESVTLFGSGALNYAWDNGVNDNVAFTPLATTTYTVIGTDGNGCQNTDQISVTVNPLPTVDFISPDTNGCEPHTANFVNLTPNSVQCSWSFGDGGNSGSCGNVSHTYPTEGCYDVTLTITDNNGCTNSTTKLDYVCVDKLPIADFSQSDEYVTESNSFVDFYNQSLGADFYEWSFNVTETSTDINPTVDFPTLPATYEVVLVAYTQNGCTDTAWSDVHVEEEILFYVPNTFTPDGDEFNEVFLPIMTSGFNPYEYTLFVFNRWGEPVFESHNTEMGWDGTYQGELAEDGVYVWQIEFKDNLTDKRRTYRGHVNLLK